MSKFLEDSYVDPCKKRGCIEVDSINLPNGAYKVNGSGYSFSISDINYNYTVVTNEGVRGMYKETVAISDGKIISMPLRMTLYKILSDDKSHIRDKKIDEICE